MGWGRRRHGAEERAGRLMARLYSMGRVTMMEMEKAHPAIETFHSWICIAGMNCLFASLVELFVAFPSPHVASPLLSSTTFCRSPRTHSCRPLPASGTLDRGTFHSPPPLLPSLLIIPLVSLFPLSLDAPRPTLFPPPLPPYQILTHTPRPPSPPRSTSGALPPSRPAQTQRSRSKRTI